MIFNSYSKINLTLKVNSKNNGLHQIQSYYCLIDLTDKIKITKFRGNKDKVSFKGPFAKLVKKKDNSVINLLKILRSLKLISNYYSIRITKNIPVFSGLGGGTGNAAFLLKHLLKNRINKNIFYEVENKIGSDLRLFFSKQGFLENLNSIIELKKKQKLYFVLIQPHIKCSTKEIYSRVKNYSKKEFLVRGKNHKKESFLRYLSKNRNDLQLIVEKKYPFIKKVLADIKNEKGCCFSRMTGSGSVCYGLFKDKIAAKKAFNKLKITYSKSWLSFAKTV